MFSQDFVSFLWAHTQGWCQNLDPGVRGVGPGLSQSLEVAFSRVTRDGPPQEAEWGALSA